ncbi:MAG TPA: hypothetical protein DCZ95_06480 [Verrucomicrobia bacterium]|nr:MAG: hypothetical protein A2X46_16185 [Lentisphaerae bacterium GWF2_57_35]HBA83723.1 hypothetical protein [Verrucomicrobiota bacterium]
MKLIRPNCRLRFTSTDLDFLISSLATSGSDSALRRLTTDLESLDLLLDEEALFHALLDRPEWAAISSHFYFYVLVRHVLKKAGLDDRAVADYVAELLAEFCQADRARPPLPPDNKPSDYLVDMLAALQWVTDEERFALRAHIGNISLFMTGVFPERLQARTRDRGAPKIDYYEGMGRSSYRAAGDDRLAGRYELAPLLHSLSDSFHTTRLALNELKERIILIEPPPFMVA